MYTAMILAAGTWYDKFNDQFSNIEMTAKNGGKAAAVIIILIALIIGKTLVKVLSACLLVGVALYAVFNVAGLKSTTEETIDPVETSMGACSAAVQRAAMTLDPSAGRLTIHQPAN